MMMSHEKFRFHGSQIPRRIHAAIVRYVEQHCPTGGCLKAILENDLKEVFFLADDEVSASMQAIVMYLYNEVPSNCYGSKDKVAAWLEAGVADQPDGGEPGAGSADLAIREEHARRLDSFNNDTYRLLTCPNPDCSICKWVRGEISLDEALVLREKECSDD